MASREAILQSIVVGIVVLAACCLTSYPSVAGGDSGELLAEACQLGVAHPPGYPLFIMLSHAFKHLPMIRPFVSEYGLQLDFNPTSGWKMTQLSTVSGGITAVFLYLSVCQVVNSGGETVTAGTALGAVTAAISYSLMPLVFEHAVSAEVFALNNALCSLLLFCTVSALSELYRARNPAKLLSSPLPRSLTRLIYSGALLSALGFANQHTSIIHSSYLIVAVVISLFATYPAMSVLQTLVWSGAYFLLGLTPYCQTMFAAWYETAHRGSWGDTRSINGFLVHVLRAEYGTFRLGFIEGQETAVQRIIIFLRYANGQLRWLPVIVPVGLLLSYLASLLFARNPATTAITPIASNSSSSSNKTSNNSRKSRGSGKNTSVAAVQSVDSAQPAVDSSIGVLWHLSAVVGGNFVFYTLLWHGVFSNLPLSHPMAFGVHSRFWMQPSLSLALLLGVGVCCAAKFVQGVFCSLAGSSSSESADTHATTSSKSGLSWLAVGAGVLAAAVVLQLRWSSVYDRGGADSGGWVLHRFGQAILDAVPPGAVLLSHTDLDLNPARYLRVCESRVYGQKQMQHISLQMMPYPWFKVQQAPWLEKEAGLVFPDVNFPGVSTDRVSEGNARLIDDFLTANYRPVNVSHLRQYTLAQDGQVLSISDPPRTIFLDMQAVNEVDLGSLGLWRQRWHLVPYGLEYLVLRASPQEVSLAILAEQYHHLSWAALQRARALIPTVSDQLDKKYPKGSWEHAAWSVLFDAHYQTGLFLLSWAMEPEPKQSRQGGVMETLDLRVDRLLAATQLLQTAWRAGNRYHTFSSSLQDLNKNTALAFLRSQGTLLVVSQFSAALWDGFRTQVRTGLQRSRYLVPDVMERLAFVEEGRAVPTVLVEHLTEAEQQLRWFCENVSRDKDIVVFRTALQKLSQALDSGKL